MRNDITLDLVLLNYYYLSYVYIHKVRENWNCLLAYVRERERERKREILMKKKGHKISDIMLSRCQEAFVAYAHWLFMQSGSVCICYPFLCYCLYARCKHKEKKKLFFRRFSVFTFVFYRAVRRCHSAKKFVFRVRLTIFDCVTQISMRGINSN